MTDHPTHDLAVIGLAVRLPGAEDVTDLRAFLTGDSVTVSPVPAARWAPDLLPRPDLRGAFLQDPHVFDHEEFGLSAGDAVRIDPQHRMMLEVGARALEESGYRGRRRLRAGVFVGSRMNAYGYDAGTPGPQVPAGPPAATLWGRSQNFAAAWLADRLDLAGPALVVDTACSSSLTALWLAGLSLRSGDCDLAVVGGVDLLVDPLTYRLLDGAGALSADGLCRTFDRRADGYVPGEGAVALVLKPLVAAQRDGDRVLGTVVHVAANNDGATMGVTTPNLEAQVELLDEVYRRVGPASVQMVETHGTGTAIGDPIEVRALTEVFTRHGAAPGSVALGSLKRRIGHLHSAAGLAGLAGLLCALGDGVVPGVGVEQPNPRLQIDGGPLRLTGAAEPWPAVPVRGAGLSAFGFGGTNVHAVVTAATPAPPPVGTGPFVLTLSARTDDGLRELAAQWLEALPRLGDGLDDACATSRLSRPHRAVRVAVCGDDADALGAALRGTLLRTGPGPAPRRAPAPSAPGGDAARWLPWLSAHVPAVARLVDRFVEATGDPVVGWGARRAALCGAIAWPVALVGLGAPGAALPAEGPGAAAAAFALDDDPDPTATVAALLTDGSTIGGPGPLDGTTGPDDLVRRLDAVLAALYTDGHDLDWDGHRGGRPFRRADVPVAQADGRVLDLREPQRSAAPGGPLRVLEPQDPDGFAFERLHGPGETAIAQHSVFGTAMLPGMAWLDLLRAGAVAATGGFGGLADLVFHRPLRASRPELVTCRATGDGAFELRGKDGPYAHGRYVPGAGGAPARLDLAPLLGGCGPLRSGTTLYRRLRALGYRHGRYYRNISWVAAVPDGTLARIEGTRQRRWNDVEVALFPGLLDSVTIAALDLDHPIAGRTDAPVFIPLSIGAVQVHGSLERAAFVHTRVGFWNEEACRVTQTVTDDEGEVLLVLRDISSKRVPPTAFAPQADTEASLRTADGPARAPAAAPAPAPVTAGDPEAAGDPSGPDGRPAPAVVLDWFLAETGLGRDAADEEFLSAGFDSVGLVELSERLSRDRDLSLYPTVFFEFPTPQRFAAFLAEDAPALVRTLRGERPVTPGAGTGGTGRPPVAGTAPPATPARTPSPAAAQPAATPETAPAAAPVAAAPAAAVAAAPAEPDPAGRADRDPSRDIAVVGLAIRVPGASTPEQMWQLLRDGVDTVDGLPPGRWTGHDGAGPRASFLPSIDRFDPAPFRISPREAPMIDPQARIVYETIWEALEDGGRIGPRAEGSRTGLWIAYSHDHYHEERARLGVGDGRGLGLEAMIPNRFSHLMDWTGPSMVVNTLCSSALVALHTALAHLRSGDIDTAVVAGVHAAISPEYFTSMGAMRALSPRARCAAFDAEADGFVPGEGASAVVLRRAGDAAAEGDRVRGLVIGAAVNHGGRTSRYSAPSPTAQRDVITAALRDAAVSPDSISLVEAHGTGTSLGDPIEIDGLTRAWRPHTDRRQFCAIGSVKSNIGHLEPAAGLAGLVKVLLALEHATIPPTLHLTRPNDHIRFEDTPFFPAVDPLPWDRVDGRPRRAALSAFGMGGVNAHVVLEEPAVVDRAAAPAGRNHVVTVSAPTEDAVRDLAGRYARTVAALPGDDDLAAVAWTACAGRARQRHRVAVHGTTRAELAARLDAVAATAPDAAPVARAGTGAGGPPVFLFTGQGSQYPGMGSVLYRDEPVFRAAVDDCASLLAPWLTVGLHDLLFGSEARVLTRTDHAQVAIVAVQVGLVRLLDSWGIRPGHVIGHSVGELTAAWAAGCLALPELMRVTARRGRAMLDQPATGSMAVVHADRATVAGLLRDHPELEIAAHNGPSNTAVAGPRERVAALRTSLAAAARPVAVTPLSVSHAFHSRDMAGAVPALRAELATAGLRPPEIGFTSTVTGTRHTDATATDPQTWADGLVTPVLFHEALSEVHRTAPAGYWEIGPQPVLARLAADLAPQAGFVRSTLARGRDDTLHRHLCDHHNTADPEVDPAGAPRRPGPGIADLPRFPFARSRYWVGDDIGRQERKPTDRTSL
ncbi:acyltransferase domain-containing protein [Pseudonocardia sp. ICBG1122]|nr:acyltransferase domain-containing protein [Pseudonocardia pini]